MLMEDVLKMFIGLLLICISTGVSLLCMLTSLIMFFSKNESKLPPLIMALLSTAAFLMTDILFPVFNFRRTSGTTIMIMDIVIVAVSVMTALSFIYSIVVMVTFIKQKKYSPTEEQKNG